METRTTVHDDTSDQITRTRSRVDATNSLEILGQPSRAYPHLSTHTHTRIVSVKRVGHWVHAKRQKASICITRRTGQNTHTHTHARGKHIEGVEKDSRVGGNAFCIPSLALTLKFGQLDDDDDEKDDDDVIQMKVLPTLDDSPRFIRCSSTMPLWGWLTRSIHFSKIVDSRVGRREGGERLWSLRSLCPTEGWILYSDYRLIP